MRPVIFGGYVNPNYLPLTPLAIAQLMVAYTGAIAYSDRDRSVPGVQARHKLYRLGLIEIYGESSCSIDRNIKLTEKGRVFCEMLLATPLPVEAPVLPQVAWKDPRS